MTYQVLSSVGAISNCEQFSYSLVGLGKRTQLLMSPLLRKMELANEMKPPALHATVTSCQPISYNVYETLDKRSLPTVSQSSGEPHYGTITTDVNAGLRLPQARPMNIETFNSGCVNPHGCVSNIAEGFACPGPLKQPSSAISNLYDVLQAPYAPHNFEMKPPPPYVVGIKETSLNSVVGWRANKDGKQEWQTHAATQPCGILV